MKAAGSHLSEVAAVAQRLAVLLAAGVAPVSAWMYVAEASSSTIASAVVSNGDPPAAILAAAPGFSTLESEAWRGLAAAWWVATSAGAPLAPSLRDYAHSIRALAGAQRDLQVALAGPIATARMVMALPAIGIVFGVALGFDTLHTLLATAPGWLCLALGCALLFAASRWNRRLIAAAQPPAAAPGLECDLMAIAVSGGGSLERARVLIGQCIERFGLVVEVGRTHEVLELSRRAGVPAGELLRSEGTELRRAARAEAQERAARLSVRLMLPLGLCVLPAFMVVGVFPLLLSVISSTVDSF